MQSTLTDLLEGGNAEDFQVDEYPCLVQLFSQSECKNEVSIESVQVSKSLDRKRHLQ